MSLSQCKNISHPSLKTLSPTSSLSVTINSYHYKQTRDDCDDDYEVTACRKLTARAYRDGRVKGKSGACPNYKRAEVEITADAADQADGEPDQHFHFVLPNPAGRERRVHFSFLADTYNITPKSLRPFRKKHQEDPGLVLPPPDGRHTSESMGRPRHEMHDEVHAHIRSHQPETPHYALTSSRRDYIARQYFFEIRVLYCTGYTYRWQIGVVHKFLLIITRSTLSCRYYYIGNV